jgi:glycerate-2-kinase
MDLRACAERIWREAIAAVEPGRLVRPEVVRSGRTLRIGAKAYDLQRLEDIFLLAFGKAAPAMAAPVMDVVGDRVRDGVVTILPGRSISLKGLKVIEAPHPLPDGRSVAAAEAVLRVARRAGEKDLVIVLLSGGSSAQVCAPSEGVTFEDKAVVTRELARRGADIFELNAVRKHLSVVKGGRLALAAAPAAVAGLVLSDVPGDDLQTIGSGPLHWDGSTFEDARAALLKFDLWDETPVSVRRTIEEGLRGRRPETPKRDHPAFAGVVTRVVGNNAAALRAARGAAEALGFRTIVLSSGDRGEARTIAVRYAAALDAVMRSPRRPETPVCLLGGGELTVTVRGPGRGGRNQEFALAALGAMLDRPAPGTKAGTEDWLIASVATDGIDGPTDAAGAWAAPAVAAAARSAGLDWRRDLDRNDSYEFFRRAGALILIGPTGTNVMDLRMMLVSAPDRPGRPGRPV